MLYVIAGNGTGTATEITAALKDLRDAATKADMEFWFLVEGKEEPTKTDEAIYKWLRTNEVWFEVLTSTGIVVDGAQESVGTDDVYGSMLERIHERAEENEPAALLILPIDPDGGTTDDDETLMDLVERCVDADVEVFQLNGRMIKITMAEEDETEEAEEAPAPVKKAAKKAAAAPAAPAKVAAKASKVAKKALSETEVAEAEVDAEVEAAIEEAVAEALEDDETVPSVVYTAEELAKMTVAELTAVAKGQGIDVKGLGKKDLIAAIKQTTAPAPAQVATTIPAPESNGEMVLMVLHLPGRFVSGLVPMGDALALIAG